MDYLLIFGHFSHEGTIRVICGRLPHENNIELINVRFPAKDIECNEGFRKMITMYI